MKNKRQLQFVPRQQLANSGAAPSSNLGVPSLENSRAINQVSENSLPDSASRMPYQLQRPNAQPVGGGVLLPPLRVGRNNLPPLNLPPQAPGNAANANIGNTQQRQSPPPPPQVQYQRQSDARSRYGAEDASLQIYTHETNQDEEENSPLRLRRLADRSPVGVNANARAAAGTFKLPGTEYDPPSQRVPEADIANRTGATPRTPTYPQAARGLVQDGAQLVTPRGVNQQGLVPFGVRTPMIQRRDESPEEDARGVAIANTIQALNQNGQTRGSMPFALGPSRNVTPRQANISPRDVDVQRANAQNGQRSESPRQPFPNNLNISQGAYGPQNNTNNKSILNIDTSINNASHLNLMPGRNTDSATTKNNSNNGNINSNTQAGTQQTNKRVPPPAMPPLRLPQPLDIKIINDTSVAPSTPVVRTPVKMGAQAAARLAELRRRSFQSQVSSQVPPPFTPYFHYQRVIDLRDTASLFLETDDQNRQPCALIMFESIVPILLVMAVLAVIWWIDNGVKQYCYLTDICACDSGNSLFWSWVRPTVIYKLGHLAYKRQVFSCITHEPKPYMEGFLLYLLVLGIDLTFVLGIEVNRDIAFLCIVFGVALIVPTHMLRFRHFWSQFWDGRGLWLYDVSYLLQFLFYFLALPAIYTDLVTRYRQYDGRLRFIYVYPALELVPEAIMEATFAIANRGDFFLYQSQFIVFGARIGMLASIDQNEFEFWYLAIFFMIKRIFTATQVLWVPLRKVIFGCCPSRATSMDAYTDEYKGKNGAYLEHCIFFMAYWYWMYGQKTLLTPYVFQTRAVESCAFDTPPIIDTIPWFKMLIVCALFLFGEVVTFLLNKQTGYDTIKFVGAPRCNLFDNVVIRLIGVYFFQLAALSPILLLTVNGIQNFVDVKQAN